MAGLSQPRIKTMYSLTSVRLDFSAANSVLTSSCNCQPSCQPVAQPLTKLRRLLVLELYPSYAPSRTFLSCGPSRRVSPSLCSLLTIPHFGWALRQQLRLARRLARSSPSLRSRYCSLGRPLLLYVAALLDRSLLLLSSVARCPVRLRLFAGVCCVALLHVRQVYRLADPVISSLPTLVI
jgi:hypothetical protein